LTETTLLSSGGITFWILIDTPDTAPLCACETFNRKRGLIKSPTKPAAEVPVIGVASVFTPPQNRGKRYAGVMMQLLSRRLREITGGQGFSVLYSDIGPQFYDKNGGWKSVDAFELELKASKEFHEFEKSTPISFERAKECIERDARYVREEFASLAKCDTTVVQLIPQYGELEWAQMRGKHAAERFKIDIGDMVGAEISTPSDEDWGYILWFHEFKESSLTVLRLREPTSDLSLLGLLQVALDEARRCHLSKVTIWTSSRRLETLTGCQITSKTSSLPALLFLSVEEKTDSEEPESETPKLVWRNIEKLGWC
jgi:hypothetical protein